MGTTCPTAFFGAAMASEDFTVNPASSHDSSGVEVLRRAEVEPHFYGESFSGHRPARADDLIEDCPPLGCDPLQMRLQATKVRLVTCPFYKDKESTMAIIAEAFEFVVGVDTLARTQTITAVHATTGE